MLTALLGATAPFVFLLVALAVFTVLGAVRGTPATPASSRQPSAIATPHLTRFIQWLLTPADALLARLDARPGHVTVASFVLCAGAAAAIGTGAWILGGWLYVAAGLADTLDGRLARRLGTASPRGAFLDSVADRWGDLLVHGACAVSLTASWAVAAAVLALGASQMVSYTRARGEGLGIALTDGTMQRAERIILTSLGLLAGGVAGEIVLGVALAAVAVGATVTAWGRLRDGLLQLEALGRLPVARDRDRVRLADPLGLVDEDEVDGAGGQADADEGRVAELLAVEEDGRVRPRLEIEEPGGGRNPRVLRRRRTAGGSRRG